MMSLANVIVMQGQISDEETKKDNTVRGYIHEKSHIT